MRRRLVLWDIDGTLITTVGVGRRVMEEAARLAAGLAEVPVVVMGGKTDPQILTEIFTAAGMGHDHIQGILPDAMAAAERALASLEDELRANGSLLPGVQAVLERLDATPGVRQTLLTGNLTPNAAVKVAAFGITEHFDVEVGAYGTDHADRLELVPIALERVERLRGETYDPATEVWVIGDTANDLACARAGGVRCLLVGHEAAALGPEADAWFPTLADTDAVAATILGD